MALRNEASIHTEESSNNHGSQFSPIQPFLSVNLKYRFLNISSWNFRCCLIISFLFPQPENAIFLWSPIFKPWLSAALRVPCFKISVPQKRWEVKRITRKEAYVWGHAQRGFRRRSLSPAKDRSVGKLRNDANDPTRWKVCNPASNERSYTSVLVFFLRLLIYINIYCRLSRTRRSPEQYDSDGE